MKAENKKIKQETQNRFGKQWVTQFHLNTGTGVEAGRPEGGMVAWDVRHTFVYLQISRIKNWILTSKSQQEMKGFENLCSNFFAT